MVRSGSAPARGGPSISGSLQNMSFQGPFWQALNVSISGVLKYTVKLYISVALSGLLKVYISASIFFGPEIHTESYIFGLDFI